MPQCGTRARGMTYSDLQHALVTTRCLCTALHTILMKTGTDQQKALAYVACKTAYAMQNDGDLDDAGKFLITEDGALFEEKAAAFPEPVEMCGGTKKE